MKNRSLFSILLVFVLLTSFGFISVAESTPKSGGEVIIGLRQEVGNLDPHLATSFSSFRVIDVLYEGLLRHGENGKLKPALAKNWEISEDERTYTFSLRKNVTFHDGTQLTAEDVKASYERILDPDVGSPQADRLEKIESMEIVGPYEINIHLKEKDAPFLNKVSGPARAIVPKSVYEKGDNLKNKANGTGPFSLTNWVPGEELQLDKNEAYWMNDLPYLSGISYKIIPEAATRRAALQSGDIHIIPSASSTSVQVLKGVEGVKILSTQELSYSLIGFNINREPLNNKKVRKAISYAADRSEIIDAVYNGRAAVGTPISPALSEWHIPASELETYGQDYEKARELLAEAGFSEGIEFSITVSPTLDTALQIAQVFQQQLKPAGIDVELNTVEWGTFLDSWRNSNFDSFASLNSGSYDPDGYYYRTFHSEGSTNVFNYSNSDMNKLLDEGRTITNLRDRKDIYREIQKKLVEDMPIIFVAYADLYTVTSDNLMDFAQLPNRNMSTIRHAWLK